MRKSRVIREQIVQALRQAETGTPVPAICRKLGVTEATYYRWKKPFTGLDVSELRELRQVREEYKKLKQLVVELTLNTAVLREALEKNGKPSPLARDCELGANRVPAELAAGVPRT
jgi:putative transposase